MNQVNKSGINSEPKASVSSIEARRILAVLEDCKNRAEFSLILPSLSDFLEERENVHEEIRESFSDFISHHHAFSSMIDADGQPKQQRSEELNEEKILYMNSARDMIRVMKKHSDFFSPLLSQPSISGGSAVKLLQTLKELNEMMLVTFSLPVEADEKQQKLTEEIEQRKQQNIITIRSLREREAEITRERDQKIRQKEDQLDEIKQQLVQEKASETSIQQDENLPEDNENQEKLKISVNEKLSLLLKKQKENSEEENKQRRLLRKEEENLQSLIQQYDKEMETLTQENILAQIEAEKKEKELHELQNENETIEKNRTPLRHQEQGFVDKANQSNKLYQDTIAAAVKLQIEIRRFLKNAPKPPKRKPKKGSKK